MLREVFANKLFLTLFSAILFTLLFYQKPWGLNLFIFQIFWLITIFPAKIKDLNIPQKALMLGSILAILAAFIHHTYLAFVLSFGSLFLLSISLEFKTYKSLHLVLLNLVPSWIFSPILFIKSALQSLSLLGVPAYKINRGLAFVFPILVIALFFAIYANSNPTFGLMSASIFSGMETVLLNMLDFFQSPIIAFSLVGIMVSIPFFFKKRINSFISYDQEAETDLQRVKIQHFSFKKMGLKHENQMGIFLLGFLNFLIFFLLVFEIKDVWFGFNWNGEYLKEFVHEGMYLLTFSIIVSLVVVLYFFRGNLNFYKKNFWLKRLAILWLSLNSVLVCSVAIRNMIYINYFSLAYGRIILMFFLLASLIGIYSVFIKVNNRKNNHFLLRLNSLSIYLIIVFAGVFNWDVLIAKYNFSNALNGFLHLNYITTLNNSALPYMEVDLALLEAINTKQSSNLNESSSAYSRKYLSPQEFKNQITFKKKSFIEEWESKHWLSWNYAEWKAYNTLVSSSQ